MHFMVDVARGAVKGDSGKSHGAAAAWIATTVQLARAWVARDGVHAAEEKVALLPVDELVAA